MYSAIGGGMHPTSQFETPDAVRAPSHPAPRWLRAGFWICILIAVAVVIRRILALAAPSPSAPPQLAQLDAFFASHAILTLAHIVPALAFVLLAPLFYWKRLAAAAWLHRSLFVLGVVVGLTAYAMSVFPVGGWVERSAVLFFNSVFLYALVRAYQAIRHGHPLLERRWMTRAIGILLGIATTRPVMGVFFATSPLTHLQPRQFFGIAFWIGFSINTVVVELWLRARTRYQGQISA
jgi:hypothetical protein